MFTLSLYQQRLIDRLRAFRRVEQSEPVREPQTTAVERMRKMAAEAIDQYSAEALAGGEPVFPDWARDMLKVCDEHEAMSSKLQQISA